MMAEASAEPGGLGAFLAWWADELIGLLPRRWRASRGTRSSFVLHLSKDVLEIRRRRRRRLVPLGTIELPPQPALPGEGGLALLGSGARRLVRILREARGSRVLALEPDAGLLSTDILPAVAEGNLRQIMRHRLEVMAPWPTEEIHAGHRILERRPDGTLEVLVGLAPRALVDPLLARLAAVGIEVDGVDLLREDAADTLGLNLIERRARARGGFWPRAVLALGLLALLALLGAGGWRYLDARAALGERARYAAALEQRLADLPELKARVDSLREEAGFIVAERQALPSPLAVLETLSRVLPESVWLDELDLEGRSLTISGFAEDAAQVLPIIESSPDFSGAEFRAPSTRVSVPGPGGGTRQVERFSLSAQVDPAPGAGP